MEQGLNVILTHSHAVNGPGQLALVHCAGIGLSTPLSLPINFLLASCLFPPRIVAIVPPLLHNRGLSTASAIMSNVTEMVNDVSLRKTSPETSSREIPKTYELDSIDSQDVGDNYHDHLGVTRNDRRDMSRMGKIQQLRVRGQVPQVRLRFS
jgi:hypothetical protein